MRYWVITTAIFFLKTTCIKVVLGTERICVTATAGTGVVVTSEQPEMYRQMVRLYIRVFSWCSGQRSM